MRTIAHISDVHFGRHIPAVVQDLADDLTALRPDLLVLSGDLTQRAKSKEFALARDFLDDLGLPLLVVPGNHDVTLYNLWRRFFRQLSRYKRLITDDLTPQWSDDELAVMGISTARSLTLSHGRISYWQMARARQFLCDQPDDRFKVLVTHHPFLAPPASKRKGVGRYRHTLKAIEPCAADLLLAGHFHMSYSRGTHAVHRSTDSSILVLQAGTAVSDRTRGEPNSYNVLRVDKQSVRLEVRFHSADGFQTERRQTFVKDDQGHWKE